MDYSQLVAILKFEYPRRRQIFDESIKLIQKTNNPDVLHLRYSDIEDFINWAFDMKQKGLPITIQESESEMRMKLPRFFNYHCVRIAHYIFEQSPQKKQFRLLSDLLISLREADNKEDAHIEISELINKCIIKQ